VRPAQLEHGQSLLRAAIHVQDVTQCIEADRRCGIQCDGPSGTPQRFVQPADSGEVLGVLLVGLDVVRVDPQRPQIAGLGLLPLPPIPVDVSQRDLGRGVRRVDLERAKRRTLGGCQRSLPDRRILRRPHRIAAVGRVLAGVHVVHIRRSLPIKRNQRLRLGQPRPCRSPAGVLRDRRLEQLHGLLNAVPPRSHAGPSREVQVVRVEVAGRRHEPRPVFQAQRYLQLPGDRVDRPVVGIRPEVEVVGRVHELCGDPEAVTLLPDAALHEVLHPEFRPDLAQVPVLALVGEGGCPSADPDLPDLGERVEQLLGHAVGEEFLVLVPDHVHERKHGE